MRYLVFSIVFTVLHAIAYMVAGVVALRISKDVYESKSRKLDYVRDMEDPAERSHVQRFFFPAQLARGLLLSVVLYPILSALGETGYLTRTVFLFGILFVYTHIASAAPCPDNVEGLVYLKREYIDTSMILKFQMEMVLYSVLFAGVGGWLLFR